VGGNLRLTRQLPRVSGATDLCSAVLVINNGTVTVGGGVVDGGGTTSMVITNNGVLDLQPTGDLTPGAVAVKSLTLGEGNLTNWSTLTTASITLAAPATEFGVQSGQTLIPVPTGAAGALNVNGSLALSNATVKYDLGDTSTYDQIIVANNLTLNGISTLEINTIGTLTPYGTYTLMTYAGTLSGTVGNLALAGTAATSRYAPVLDTGTAGQVNLVLSGASANLTWSGGANGNAWDVANSVNFNYDSVGGTNTEKFYNLDNVNFDSSSTNTNVNLAGTLFPSTITINSDYTLAGSGTIGGAAAVTVNSSKLVLLTTNSFGTSTSTIQNNGGTLIFAPAADTQSVLGTINGYGTLAKQGQGVTVLAGANTFNGDIAVEEGMVIVGTTTSLGDTSGKTTVTNGATLDINGQNLSPEPFYVSGAGVGGKGAIVNNGAGQADALALITMTGDTTLGGSGGRMDINNVSGTPGGLVSNPAGSKLTKMGTNAVSLFNNYGLTAGAANLFDTQIGDIEVKEGVLRVQCGTVLGDPTKTITVRSNATFQLDNLWAANTVNKVVVLDDGAGMYGTRSAAYDYFGGPITLKGVNSFDVISGAYFILTNEITGTGSLVKNIGYHPGSPETSTGTGTLILMANNTFTGDFKVQTGTVILTNDASVATAASIWMAGGTLTVLRTDATLALATGQTIKGNGTLNGKLSSPANTTVSPGATTTVATLTLKGDTTLRGTTLMDITKTNTTLATDRLAVTGTLDLGGTLTVSLASNTNLAAGDKFTLFTATSFINSLSATNLPVLPAGFAWSNSIVATSWIIEVIATEPPTPPTLTNFFNGSSLMLSWDTAYSTYVLEGETNPISTGLTTNSADWHPVPGVSGNQINIPVDPVNGSVFFRLRR
jgi:autotransporter-associated beta strand protein